MNSTIADSTSIRARRAVAPAYLPLLGRAAMAAIFILSGVSKLFAPAATMGYIGSVGLPVPAIALALAIILEIGGGTLLVLGYRTRLVATALAVFSVVTAFSFHSDLADQNQFIHFFKNVAIAGGLAQIIAFGGGALSLDARQ